MALHAVPINFSDAADFVRLHHRHHTPPSGHKFSIGAVDDGGLVGVVIVGRPVRVKTSEASYIHNRHPLVEADMTRRDCLNLLSLRQYPVAPKSSCIFCPFRDRASWKAMAENDPADFEDAVSYDEAWRPGYPGMEGAAYIHQSRRPLREIVFDTQDSHLELPFEEPEQCDACGI